MELQPHQQRVVDEKAELDKKATALSNFIGHSHVFEKLDAAEQERLKEQCEVMWQYSEILGARIAAFTAASVRKVDTLSNGGPRWKSWIVYGPQGTGKTLHARAIAKALGLRFIVDEWDERQDTLAPLDTLHLAIELPAWARTSRRVMTISEALAKTRGAGLIDSLGHAWGEFPHQYTGESGSECRSRARRAGWTIGRNGSAVCPKCNAKTAPSNAEVSGRLRAPMPEDAPRTAAGSPLDRPVGPVAGA